ncbi:MAG: glycosyltransferase [Proteobacteria bacterium]|nr:glycosyltransferase [Pseudomonadota bacterium]
MRYSIIVPTFNGLRHLYNCIASTRKHTKDYEIIVVSNGSADGTLGFLEEQKKQMGPMMKVISLPENTGFANACNMGMAESIGDNIILLNDDCIVTPEWADRMFFAMNNAQQMKRLDNIALVGPCSNFVAGNQMVRNEKGEAPRYQLSMLDHFANDIYKKNPQNWALSGFLSGFCMMFTRAVYEKLGGLETWKDFANGKWNPGGFEDNDYVLRAYHAGFSALIAGDTYVHHEGSKTMNSFPEMKGGVANHEFLIRKWMKLTHKENPKLVAAMRIKWPPDGIDITEVLDATHRFADEIVVVDNGMEPDFLMKVKSHPGVVAIQQTEGLQERRDRNILIEMARDQGADWIISVDADEVFEEKFDRAYAKRLMNAPFPENCAYAFHWYTLWNTPQYWRSDGIFGSIAGGRMWRVVPNKRITAGNEQGFHCGNMPAVPGELTRWTSIRVKHYGYVTEEERQRKYQWYERNDTDRREELIGAPGYDHLVQEAGVVLTKYKENSGLSLAMIVRDEEEFVLGSLRTYWAFADEMIVVDTGSKDRTKELAELLGAKIFDFEWVDDFAVARNFAKDKCSNEWILQMDPDEEVEFKVWNVVRRMMDSGEDAFVFQFQNLHPSRVSTPSETIRLYRNIPEFWYTGCAHETFEEALESFKGAKIGRAPFLCLHKGYMKAPAFIAGKMKDYFALNQKQLAANPKDTKAMHSIAVHLLNLGKFDEAGEWLIKANGIRPSLLVKRQLAQLFARYAADQLRDMLEQVRLPEGDKQYTNEFLNALKPFEFVNVPVPHEGEHPIKK